jgi:SAM-dependent methyltransferase
MKPEDWLRDGRLWARFSSALLAWPGRPGLALQRCYEGCYVEPMLVDGNDSHPILDLGSGDGATARYFAPHRQFVHLDRETIRLGRCPEDASRLIADLTFIPIRSNTIHEVLLGSVLEHVPDPLPCLREARRVLKPGGTAIIVVPLANYFRGHYSRTRATRWEHQCLLGSEEWLEVVEKAGFEVQSFAEFMPTAVADLVSDLFDMRIKLASNIPTLRKPDASDAVRGRILSMVSAEIRLGLGGGGPSTMLLMKARKRL